MIRALLTRLTHPHPHPIAFICDTPSAWLSPSTGVVACVCNRKDTK